MTSNSSGVNGSKTRPRVRASLMRRTPHRAVVYPLLALFAFDVLFYVFAVYPLSNREAEQQARIVAIKARIEAKKAAAGTLAAAVEKVEQAGKEGDRLLEELTFERRATFSRLLTELDRAAREAGVEVRETNYESEEIAGAEEYGMVSIRANLRGRYENLVRFLNLIDRSERFLIIGSLGASPREDTGELQITMRIDTFVRES